MTHCRNVLVLAIALGASAGLVVLPGCSTTKNVMHKATFGLVGNEERPETDSRKEAKAERKAREREEKQQRKAEKRARRDEAKARKTAQKEEKSQQADAKPKRGLLDRMTFGMVGGDDESDGPKKQEKRAKAEAEEQERAEKKRAEKAAKEDEEAQKRAAKQDAEQAKREEKEASEKRGLMNRMTFGLAGGHKKTDEEKAQEKAAKAEAKEAARAEKQHKKDQERREDEVKAAEKREAKERKEAEQAAQAESDAEAPSEKRSMMSRMTFGLVGGGKKQHSDSETAPDSPAEAATVEAPQREVSESATPAGTTTEPAIAADKPKEKRGWMSRMTFGLVGGGEKKEMHDEMPVGGEAGGTSTAAQPALPPEHLAMAAPANVAYDVQPASAMGAEERKLAKLPFKTMIDLSTKSASGRPQATASRETYSRSGYGITDIGDVRIAVRDMTFNGESRAGGIVIASDDRAPAGGRSGIGNESFVFEYARGVTACTFGSVQFTISKSVINIGGKSIPLGQGRKLVVVDQQGNVLGAYAAE